MKIRGKHSLIAMLQTLSLAVFFTLLTNGAWAQSTSVVTEWVNPGFLSSYNNSVDDPINVLDSDNSRATFNSNNDMLTCAGFTFNIPSDAIIKGIEVGIEGYNFSSSWWGARGLNIFLSWNGADLTSNKPKSSSFTFAETANFTMSEVFITLGGGSDIWGHNWTVSELSDANFKVGIISSEGSSGNLYIDQIKVRVCYEEVTIASVVVDGEVFEEQSTGVSDFQTAQP